MAVDPDSWWSELLGELAGYTRPKAKLNRFCGQSALQDWLPTVIGNFLRRWRFDGGEGSELDDPPAG